MRGFLIFFFAACLITCAKKNDSMTNPPDKSGILINSSFELNGNPSLQGWTGQDTSFIKFSSDVPGGGGSFSITLDAVWAPPVFVKAIVAAPQGIHIYKLSVWSKAHGIGGWIDFVLQRPDSLILRKQIRIVDSTWALYSVTDTMNCSVQDSIVVKLTGGFSQLLTGKTFYDLCTLEKLD